MLRSRQFNYKISCALAYALYLFEDGVSEQDTDAFLAALFATTLPFVATSVIKETFSRFERWAGNKPLSGKQLHSWEHLLPHIRKELAKRQAFKPSKELW